MIDVQNQINVILEAGARGCALAPIILKTISS